MDGKREGFGSPAALGSSDADSPLRGYVAEIVRRRMSSILHEHQKTHSNLQPNPCNRKSPAGKAEEAAIKHGCIMCRNAATSRLMPDCFAQFCSG